METLRRQVRRARKRLVLQLFLGKLAWCWFATLFLAAVAIGLGKVWPEIDQRTWALGCLATAFATGLLAAGLWTWWRTQSLLETAAEIDRRFGLKERVSSSLALHGAELESRAGKALVDDASVRLGRIDVAERGGRHVEGLATAGVGWGRKPAGRPVGGKLHHTFWAERPRCLPRIPRIGHRGGTPVRVTKLEQVLHPVDRRQTDGQPPAVAITAKVELVAGDAHILAQPHAGQPVPGIGHPEDRRRAVDPGTRHGHHSRFTDHSHMVPVPHRR